MFEKHSVWYMLNAQYILVTFYYHENIDSIDSIKKKCVLLNFFLKFLYHFYAKNTFMWHNLRSWKKVVSLLTKNSNPFLEYYLLISLG